MRTAKRTCGKVRHYGRGTGASSESLHLGYSVAVRARSCIVAVFLVLTCSAWAQVPRQIQLPESTDVPGFYCPKTWVLPDLGPKEEYWLKGAFGRRPVRMYLGRDKQGMVGVLYYRKGDWTPIVLGGESSHGVVRLAGRTGGKSLVVRIEGKLTKTALAGHWSSVNGDHGSFRLAIVPRIRCDGTGPWKRFESRKWKIGFSYPASWHLSEFHDSAGSILRLVCPDPKEMAYGREIDIAEGSGRDFSNSAGLPVRCPEGWRYGSDCTCKDPGMPGCAVPGVTHRQGMTILNMDAQVWRTYCHSGGYVGLGDGADRMVLLPGGWIEIWGEYPEAKVIGQMVDSVRPHSKGGH